MERQIGEIFEHNGEWFQCLEEKTCTCFGCDFRDYNCDDISLQRVKGSCQSDRRKDNKSVIFKKLEKVGEPIIAIGRTFQKFTNSNSCVGCVFCNENNGCDKCCYLDELCSDNEIWIEIKNKGNMKMKKVFMNGDDRDYLLDRLEDILHDNHCLEYKNEICNSLCKYITSNNRELKPFNLEDAKAGKPVCTRDGRKARIICFDKMGIYPVVALVRKEGVEVCHFYTEDGKCVEETSNDLMMLPEKKEGWVNIYRGQVYNTFEKAKEARKIAEHDGDNYLNTIKIDWEE